MGEEDDIDLDFDEDDENKNCFDNMPGKPMINTYSLPNLPKSSPASSSSFKCKDSATRIPPEKKSVKYQPIPQDVTPINNAKKLPVEAEKRSHLSALKETYKGNENLGRNTKRKFPGPAGIVTMKPAAGDKRIVPNDNYDENVAIKTGVLVSEENLDLGDFNKCEVWNKAVEEIRKVLDQDVSKYSTEQILSQQSVVIPYFLCKIVKIETSFRDPVVTLADKYGTIEGTFHREILDIYGKDIKNNNVLFLTKVAVLKTFKSKYL